MKDYNPVELSGAGDAGETTGWHQHRAGTVSIWPGVAMAYVGIILFNLGLNHGLAVLGQPMPPTTLAFSKPTTRHQEREKPPSPLPQPPQPAANLARLEMLCARPVVDSLALPSSRR